MSLIFFVNFFLIEIAYVLLVTDISINSIRVKLPIKVEKEIIVSKPE